MKKIFNLITKYLNIIDHNVSIKMSRKYLEHSQINNKLGLVIISLLIFTNGFGQLSYPAPDYYGYSQMFNSDAGMTNASYAISINPISVNSTLTKTNYETYSNQYYKTIIKKKNTNNYYFDLLDPYSILNKYGVTPINTQGDLNNSNFYFEVPNVSNLLSPIINGNKSFTSNNGCLGFQNIATPTTCGNNQPTCYTLSNGTKIAYIPNHNRWHYTNDSVYMSNNITNSKSNTRLITVGNGTNYYNTLLINGNVESNTLVKIWWLGIEKYNESLGSFNGAACTLLGTINAYNKRAHVALKKYKDISIIVTDPINWSSNNGYDYKYNGSNLNTAVLNGTNSSSIQNICGGTYNPRDFLNMNTSIVDTLWNNVQSDRGITQAEIYKYNGTSWILVGSGKGNYLLQPSSNYMLRYYYQLADDPATTSGIQYGYREVFVNTKTNALLPSTSVQNHYNLSPGSELRICENATPNTQTMQSIMLNTTANNFYNTYSDPRNWVIRRYSNNGGMDNTVIYASGVGTTIFDFKTLPKLDYNANGGQAYIITMSTSTSNLCNHQDYQTVLIIDTFTPVNIGIDKIFCSNAAAYTIPNSPTGGSFNTINGLSSNIFTPSSTNVGVNNIVYTYTNFRNCVSKDTAIMTVYSNPKPNIGKDTSFCDLTNNGYTIPNAPVGGIFKNTSGGSVVGLTGSTYNPSTFGVGSNSVIYEVNNGNNCYNSDTAIYTTLSNPKPSLGVDKSFCTGDANYTIPNTPTGGTFNTVVGLTGNVFSPVTAGAGTSTIFYSINTGICSNKDTAIMQVFSSPPVIQLSKDTITTCNNYGSIDLTSNVINPPGVNWVGSGVTNNYFYPSVVSSNNYYQLIGTLSLGSCSRTDTVWVNNKQGINLSNITGISLCINNANYNLNNLVSTNDKGGKHYMLLNPNRILSDSIIQTSISLGTNAIKYFKTTANGCSDTLDYTLVVNDKPSAPTSVRTNDSVCTIVGAAANYITLQSIYNISTPSGATINWVGSNHSNGTIDKNALVPNTTYTYKLELINSNNCIDTFNYILKSNNGSNSVLSFTKIYDTICHSLNALDLSTYNINAKGGVWSYSQIPSAIQSNKDLNLNLITMNSPVTLNYNVDTNKCPVTKSLTIVRFKPNVSSGLDKNICSNAEPIQLVGVPSGGKWYVDTTPTPVYLFDPKTLSINQSNSANNYSLYYSVQQSNCMAIDTAVYTIIKKPTATFVKSSDSVCKTIPSVDLTSTFGVTPTTGIWLGSNLSGNILSTTASGPGVKTFNYVISNSFGCYDTTSYSLKIEDNDSSIYINSNDKKVCESEAPINLNQFIINSKKGVWSGTTIIDSVFYPVSAGVGNFNLIYSINKGACSFRIPKKMVVIPKPEAPTYSGNTNYCKGQTAHITVTNINQTYQYDWLYDNIPFNNSTSFDLFINKNTQVEITAKNDIGCSSFKTIINLILDTPSGAITATKDTVNNYEDILFNIVNSTNLKSSIWDFKDGSDKFDKTELAHYFYNPSTSEGKLFNVECILTSNTGCSKNLSKSIFVRKRITNSISNILEETDIKVYPNPASEYIVLEDNNFNKNTSLSLNIYDINGKKVENIEIINNKTTLNIQHLTNGIYLFFYKNKYFKINKI